MMSTISNFLKKYSSQYFKILITGLVMGVAEVVPGVSGGTIAFIAGIYERLILAFHRLNPQLFKQLKQTGLVSTWKTADLTFLVVLFAGMGIGILLFARGVSYLLYQHPVLIWSFFFGLVIASSLVVIRQVQQVTGAVVSSGVAGMILGVVITQLVPLELEPTPVSLFFGGAIAVCAWILPGMSGSFILLVLGLYAFVIEAVKTFDFSSLTFLALGCILGLIAFSQVLARLFRLYKNQTLSALTGFMVGSLVKLWPWKNTLSYQIQQDGTSIPIVQEPVLPADYEALTGADPQIALALGIALAGCAIILILDYVWLSKLATGHQAEDDSHL